MKSFSSSVYKPVTHVSSLYTREEKVPDRADEEVFEPRLITSSPRPEVVKTISCALDLNPR